MTYLYFMFSGIQFCKIGISDDPNIRVTDLQTGNPETLSILGTVECVDRDSAVRMETAFHTFYSQLHVRDEWFEVSPGKVLSDINLILSLPVFRWNQVNTELSISNGEYVSRSDKRQSVFDYFDQHPDEFKDSVRTLAIRIGVSPAFIGNMKSEYLVYKENQKSESQDSSG